MKRSTRDLRRRGLVLLMIVGLLMASAAPALAKPGKPEEPTHEVAMGFVEGSDGLATTCQGFTPTVIMGAFSQEGVLDGRALQLETLIHYDGGGLASCHGGGDPIEPLWITPYPGTNQIKLWWRFDYTRVGKATTFLELISNPDFSAKPTTRWAGTVAWVDTDGDGAPDTVRGPFTLRRHSSQGWEVLGEGLQLEFTLTITEIAG
jgi:hypothetical protein